MMWIELSLHTTAEGIDWVRTLLAEMRTVQGMRVTPYQNPDGTPTNTHPWDFTLAFYLLNDVSGQAQVAAAMDLLSPLPRSGLATDLEVAIVEKPDMRTEAEPLVHRIGRFVVVSSETSYQPQAEDVFLYLPPTCSFGSGLHPATSLSLQLLERYVVPGMRVLDLGTGSGILSIAMAKLGAQVLALDNDPMAVQAAQAAIAKNSVEDQVTVLAGSLGRGSELGHWMGGQIVDAVTKIQAEGEFDLIVANILARILIALAPELQRVLRRSTAGPGWLITSGFTTDRDHEVNTAFVEAGLQRVECARWQEWIGLVHSL